MICLRKWEVLPGNIAQQNDNQTVKKWGGGMSGWSTGAELLQ